MSGIPLKIVFGTAGLGNKEKYKSKADVQPFFDVLDKQGVTALDTAHLYGNSETYLGEVKAGDKYTIDTKWLGGWTPGSATKDNVIKTAQESLKKLGVKKVGQCPRSLPSSHMCQKGIKSSNKRLDSSMYSTSMLRTAKPPSRKHWRG